MAATRTEVAPLMDRARAQSLVDSINRGFDDIRSSVLELYESRGWEALGYPSWRECVVAEFEQSQRHLYRQLEAAQVEKTICPIGQIGSIPESHLRPLVRLEPEQQREAYADAVASAPDGRPTAKDLEASASKIAPKLNGKSKSIPVHAELLVSDGSPELAIDDHPDSIPGQTTFISREEPDYEAEARDWGATLGRFRKEILLVINGIAHEEGLAKNAPKWLKDDLKQTEAHLKELRDAADDGIRTFRNFRR